MTKKAKTTKIYVELKSQEVIVVENTNTIKANKYDKLCYEINKELIDSFLDTINQKRQKNYSSSLIINYLQLRLGKILLKESHTPGQNNFMNIVKDKIKHYNKDLHNTLDHIIHDVKHHCVSINKNSTPSKKEGIFKRELKIRSSNHSPKKKFPRTLVDTTLTTDENNSYHNTFSMNGKKYNHTEEDVKNLIVQYDNIEKESKFSQSENKLSISRLYQIKKQIQTNIKNIGYINWEGNIENLRQLKEDIKEYLNEIIHIETKEIYTYSTEELDILLDYINKVQGQIKEYSRIDRDSQIESKIFENRLQTLLQNLQYQNFGDNEQSIKSIETAIIKKMSERQTPIF